MSGCDTSLFIHMVKALLTKYKVYTLIPAWAYEIVKTSETIVNY